jgi:hypothetical protein
MLTHSALITRAIRKARDGQPPAESRIYEDNAELLIPNAAHRLAVQVAADAARRDLLRKSYTLAISNGLVDLSSDPDILTEALIYSTFYDGTDAEQIYPYVFKRHHRELDQYLNPNFGYYAEKNGFLATRLRGDGNIATSKISTPGPVVLICNHIPDFTAAEFPDQLNDDAVETLAGMLVEMRGK